MKRLNEKTRKQVQKAIIDSILRGEQSLAFDEIPYVLSQLYANIPENRRVSYGRVHTMKVLSEHLYSELTRSGAPVLEIASGLFRMSNDSGCKGVSLGMLSLYGLKDDPQVLAYFESAAASPDWETRELAQMFFRKVIGAHPVEVREHLLRLARSDDPNIRRFAAETLRPVKENSWFYRNPEYPLSVLREMFRESSPYPRTSVGNNLSDLARRLSDLVLKTVTELAESGDENSYWIAYRACRNLVKKDPLGVMNRLRVNEYKYKKTRYRRSDYQRD